MTNLDDGQARLAVAALPPAPSDTCRVLGSRGQVAVGDRVATRIALDALPRGGESSTGGMDPQPVARMGG
jgi:hypothetical protein